jgi:hypothetical protein
MRKKHIFISAIVAASALFFPTTLPYLPLPATTLNTPTTAEWINLGFWGYISNKNNNNDDVHSSKSYSEAGEDLASTLYDYASIAPSDVVLDVCMGNGDSLMLLHRKYGVRTIYGENLSYKEVEHARSRVGDYLLSSTATADSAAATDDNEKAAAAASVNNDITIAHKSATDAGAHDTSSSSSPLLLVNKITALDCAYHFDTREAFLLRSARILSFSAAQEKEEEKKTMKEEEKTLSTKQHTTTRTLALADVILKDCSAASASAAAANYASSLLQKVALRVCCFLAGIPHANAVSARQYVLAMENAGFTNVTLQEIVPSVFTGFSDFLPTHLERINEANEKMKKNKDDNGDEEQEQELAVDVSFLYRSFLLAAALFMKFADSHVTFVLIRGNI